MTLTNKEKAIALVANAIAIYSIQLEKGSVPPQQSMFDFILKMLPNELKTEVSVDLIDEVFEYVSQAHLELS